MRQIQNQGGTTNEENSKPRTYHKGGKFKTKDGTTKKEIQTKDRPQMRTIQNQGRIINEENSKPQTEHK